MIRVTVSYPSKDGARFDHDYYRANHKQLLVDRLAVFGLQRVEIDRCLSGGAGEPPPTVAAAHMIFDALEGYQQGMAKHGKEIRTDVGKYTDIRPIVVVSEIV